MSPAPPDGGWGWVVVASCFLALMLGYGSPQTVAILYPEWLLAFGEGKSLTAWVGSLVVGIGLIVGPICSLCVVNFGPRPVTIFSGVMVSGGLMLSAFAPNVRFLIFSYGIVVGVAIGLLYTSIVTIICMYFDKKRGLALGIVSTGTSVGGVVYSALQSNLITAFGLEGCLLIVGALALNVVAFAGLMRPLTPAKYYLKQDAIILEQAESEQKEEEESNQMVSVITMETKEPLVRRRSFFCWSDAVKMATMKMRHYLQSLSDMLSLLQDRVVAALCVALFVYAFGNSPSQLFLEDVARSYGMIEDDTVISVVSLYYIGAGLGKLGLGILADVPRVNSILLYALTVAVSGTGVLLVPLSSSYLCLQVVSVVLGFMTGNWTLVPYVISKLIGVDRLAEAYGVLMFFWGVGLILGPPVVGCFFDFTQSYDLAFYLCGGGMLMGSLILILATILPQRQAPPPAEAKHNGCTATDAKTSSDV